MTFDLLLIHLVQRSTISYHSLEEDTMPTLVLCLSLSLSPCLSLLVWECVRESEQTHIVHEMMSDTVERDVNINELRRGRA